LRELGAEDRDELERLMRECGLLDEKAGAARASA